MPSLLLHLCCTSFFYCILAAQDFLPILKLILSSFLMEELFFSSFLKQIYLFFSDTAAILVCFLHCLFHEYSSYARYSPHSIQYTSTTTDHYRQCKINRNKFFLSLSGFLFWNEEVTKTLSTSSMWLLSWAKSLFMTFTAHFTMCHIFLPSLFNYKVHDLDLGHVL